MTKECTCATSEALPAGSPDPHPQWLEEWRIAHTAWLKAEELSPDEQKNGDEAKRLSNLITGTQATTPAGLRAQLLWLIEDVGDVDHTELDERHRGCLEAATLSLGSMIEEDAS